MAVPSAPPATRIASPYLLLTLTPFFWACNWIVLRQSMSRVQLVGVFVSLGGVLAILSGGSLERLASLTLNRGDLLIILAMLLWSVYTIGLRWRPAGLHMLTFLFVIACVGDAA